MEYLNGTGLGILWNRIKTYIQSLNYTSNIGTVTGITMNNTSYSPVNGDVDIGTVVTDVSSKANDSEVVHTTGNETIAGDKTFTGTITGVDIYGDLYGGVYTSWAEIEHGIIVPPVNGNSGTLTLASANDGNAQLVVGNSQGNPEGGTLEEQATGGWTQLYNSVTDKTLLDELDERNNVQADWSQTTTTAADYIKNKPTIPAAQIQADWSLTTTTSLDYIKNKPDITQVNSPAKTITISGVSNTIVVGDGVSIGRNNSKIEIGSNGGDVDTITLTSNGSDGGVYVSTNVQKFYYNNKEVATKNDIPTISTDIISDGIDNTKTASPKAVKTFVEGKGYLTSETEPDFNGSVAATITSANITAWNGKLDTIVFNTAYNATSNKAATMSDIPDISTKQNVIDSSNKLSADLITDGVTNKVINVKPNWNAAAGTDAEILNKPTIPSNIIIGSSQSYTVWVGSQDAYEALTPDANTLYFIVDSST